MNNNDFIEYNGIDFGKVEKNFFLTEYSKLYDIIDNVEELIKISSNINLEYFNFIADQNLFCVFSIITSIEYIKNTGTHSISLKEFKTYTSSFYKLNTVKNNSKIQVFIKNIKGKLLSNKQIFIFYNIMVTF